MNDSIEYQDIERELGLDPIIFFKALKNGIYVRFYEEIWPPTKCKIEAYSNVGKCMVARKSPYETKCFWIKDYGKTWALTEEELEEPK